MNQSISEVKILLGQFYVQKILAEQLIKFADDKGIFEIANTLKKFRIDKFKKSLQSELGYMLVDKTRDRMIKVLVDFMLECGFLKYNEDLYIWNSNKFDNAETKIEEKENVINIFNGQLDFFERCMGYANDYLMGSLPLYKFNDDSKCIWEKFLGNIEFKFARSILIKLLLSKKKDDCKVLDLCCGPGFGLVQIKEDFPNLKATALDFTNIFYKDILLRVNSTEANRLVHDYKWEGFGNPLPFCDNIFDAVLFSCADSYIPEKNREYVYKDIFRILKPRGKLGILTRSYPDNKREYVKNIWVRRGNLCHDFMESVCEGWQGFYDAGESMRMYKKNNFDVETILFNSSIWILNKP